ncbi:MAG: DotU family type IV/VI secretion system protein [Holosporales bacterium]|jgi:type VI secretion system protein ImpK|nr:DotU family type IV/VI secretion system protein [Holosporales bacterium]
MKLNASESSVIQGFQLFYYDLLRQKEKALSLYFSNDLSSDPPLATENEKTENLEKQNEIEGSIVAIQKKLISVIENSVEAMLIRSRITNKMAENAKYIMTTLADEIFINLRWEGAGFWRFSLLEKQIFQSEVAGDKFFSMLDEVMGNMYSVSEEMAFLYLMALSLGFKGRYRDIENANEHISWYKERLYSLLHDKPSRLFYPGRSHLINSCYEYAYTENNDSLLPDIKFWTWSAIAIITIYIVVSYCVWHTITSDISDVLHKIYEQTRQGPLI